jgi:hypothetical protein
MRRGKTKPRIWTPPLRKLTPETTLGFAMIDFSREVLGINPLPWQAWLFIHAFEIVGSFDGEWRLRYRTVLVLVARQNGKTYITKVIALYFLYALEVALILGCAQDLGQAEETWEATLMELQSHDDLSNELIKVLQGKGSKEFRLSGYRRYKVATPNERNTRGKAADLVFLDELRTHKTFDGWNAASKTIKARPSAIVWCISNAGKADAIVLKHLRLQAHKMLGDPDGIVVAQEGADPHELNEDEAEALKSIGLFEWSATPGCDKWDRDEWAQANPSMGFGFLLESTIAADCATDKEWDFRVEDLCQWLTTVSEPPFPEGAWDAGIDDASAVMPSSPLSWGVDMSTNRQDMYVSSCGVRSDGTWHVEVVAHIDSSDKLVSWFRNRVHKYGGHMAVALQGSGAPISAYADLLGAIEGVEVVPCKGADLAGWAGRLYDAVSALDPSADKKPSVTPVYHRPQPVLDVAANTAAKKKTGDGVFMWDREKSRESIAPLVSVTMAFGLATTPREEEKTSAYSEYDLLVLD